MSMPPVGFVFEPRGQIPVSVYVSIRLLALRCPIQEVEGRAILYLLVKHAQCRN